MEISAAKIIRRQRAAIQRQVDSRGSPIGGLFKPTRLENSSSKFSDRPGVLYPMKGLCFMGRGSIEMYVPQQMSNRARVQNESLTVHAL